MAKPLALALAVLVLLLRPSGSGSWPGACPYRCQCFTPVQVLCSDERMASLPRNMSAQVKEFIIMTTSVAYLFSHSLEESPQLTKLVFLNNALRSIHLKALERLTELQELEISGNPGLDHVLLGTFSNQARLQKLTLNFNNFKSLLPGTFDSLKQLETLQMKNNFISALPAYLFLNLNKLRVLDLSQNRLEDVANETFSGLRRLEVLKLNNNLISHLTPDTFSNVSQLRELHLEHNKLARLSDSSFSLLTNLSVLNLRGNLLTTFSRNVFGREPTHLKELNLRGNQLTQLSSLSALTSLTDLTLSENKLSSLAEDVFINLTALENLELSENQLVTLPERIFKHLFNIKEISLHRNNLTRLEPQLFEDQAFIQRLYLSENRLETLPVGLMDSFSFQHSTRLHGNPWKCDCHLWYLHDWLLQNSQNVEMLHGVVCESPAYLRQRPVASVDRDQLLCHLSKEDVADLSSCTLQTSNHTVTIKCKADKCSPMTVKVLFQEEDGRVREHVLKNESDESQCSNRTTAGIPER
nr:carboxypeptidase N subunit 2 [Nothobranchius furzeri]